MKMIDIKLPHANLNGFYDPAEKAYVQIKTEKLDQSNTDDNFIQVVGSFFTNAATRMDVAEHKTEEIKQMHIIVCDYYCFSKNDELRGKPDEFFIMWS